MSCFVVVLLQYLFKPWKSFEFMNGVVLVTSGVFQVCPFIVACAALRRTGTVLCGLNQLVRLRRKLTKEYLPKLGFSQWKMATTNEAVEDFDDLFLVLGIVSMAEGPWVLPFVSIYGPFDPLYFFLELVLPNPMYRHIYITLTTIVIRLLVVAVCTAEGGRTLAWLTSLSLVVLNTIDKCIHIINAISDTADFIMLHSQFRLAYKMIEGFVQDVLWISLTACFCMAVELLWVVTVGFDKLPLALYAILTFAAVLVVISVVILLSKICAIMEFYENMLERRKNMTVRQLVNAKTKKARCEKMEVRAIIPLQCQVGSFYEINADAEVSYLTQVLDNVINAVILIKV
ncbi:unnamed protein product [Orchesella dallaii]|uniref:Gustatory receptor n=1 Tax=Orchesella dallaii TaxID=48710 RepID=A0ABP1Q5T0_9HEXA